VVIAARERFEPFVGDHGRIVLLGLPELGVGEPARAKKLVSVGPGIDRGAEAATGRPGGLDLW
jgi:hypothetical protein